MRSLNFHATAKLLVANGTVTFDSDQLPKDRVVKLILDGQGAGVTIGGTGVSEVRVKWGGAVRMQMRADILRSYTEAWSTHRPALTAAHLRIGIPLNLGEAPTPDSQDVCQSPFGRDMTLEVVCGAGPFVAADTLRVGWERTNVPAQLHPQVTQSDCGIPAGAFSRRNVPVALDDGAIFRGFAFVTTGLDQIEVWDGDELKWFGSAQMLQAAADADGAITNINPTFFKIPAPFTVRKARNPQLVVTTLAGWAANNPVAFYGVLPVARAA